MWQGLCWGRWGLFSSTVQPSSTMNVNTPETPGNALHTTHNHTPFCPGGVPTVRPAGHGASLRRAVDVAALLCSPCCTR